MFASDADGSGPNAEVTYSIVSTNDKFSINSTTGWVVTNAVFNFDEPDNNKLVELDIKASDNGQSQLEDVCTLLVRVKDKNEENHQSVFFSNKSFKLLQLGDPSSRRFSVKFKWDT